MNGGGRKNGSGTGGRKCDGSCGDALSLASGGRPKLLSFGRSRSSPVNGSAGFSSALSRASPNWSYQLRELWTS